MCRMIYACADNRWKNRPLLWRAIAAAVIALLGLLIIVVSDLRAQTPNTDPVPPRPKLEANDVVGNLYSMWLSDEQWIGILQAKIRDQAEEIRKLKEQIGSSSGAVFKGPMPEQTTAKKND